MDDPPATVYCIDSSSLMNYEGRMPVDIVPGLWDDLAELVKHGRLVSHREVYEEIQDGSGFLVEWTKQHRSMFVDHTPGQAALVRKIVKAFPGLSGAGKISAYEADAWLIAAALDGKRGWTAVADESAKPGKRKIPAACQAFGVPWMNGFDLLRAEGWRYVRLR